MAQGASGASPGARMPEAGHRRGAALIIAMIFVIFVVVTATYFISAMGNYRGAGTHRVRNLLATAALESGRAHVFKVLQEHALEGDHTLLDTPTPSSADAPTAQEGRRSGKTGNALHAS